MFYEQYNSTIHGEDEVIGKMVKYENISEED